LSTAKKEESTMKRLMFAVPLFCALAAPLAAAQTPPSARPAQQAPSAPAAQAPVKAHTATLEFVSYDMATKKITAKDEKGQTLSVVVEGPALKQVASFKKGDRVLVTYRDDAKGVAEAVTDMKAAPARPSTSGV
jgi:Ni/Co efflux regulator RcnB